VRTIRWHVRTSAERRGSEGNEKGGGGSERRKPSPGKVRPWMHDTRGRGERRRRTGIGTRSTRGGDEPAGRPADGAVLPDVHGRIERVTHSRYTTTWRRRRPADSARRVLACACRPVLFSRTFFYFFLTFLLPSFDDGRPEYYTDIGYTGRRQTPPPPQPLDKKNEL